MLLEDYINLHQIPELGFREYKTSEYIKRRLKNTKAKIECYKTGVFAFFDFSKVKTIGFRAEEDALPIIEDNNFNYTAKKNMHACGHDSHMAMLLNLADYINKLDDYQYNVFLVFQPSEETIGGAKAIIPFIKSHSFHAFIGVHVFPKLKKGLIYSSKNAIFGSSMEIDISLNGKASHVFTYKEKDDALKKGIKLIKQIEKKARNKDLFFHVGVFNSGVKRNICPDKAKIKASLRGKDNINISSFKEELLELNSKYIKIKCSEIIPCVRNTYLNQDELFNDLKINLLDKTMFLADDFSYYDFNFQTLFFLLGTENEYFLHENKFSLDEIDLKNGFNFLLRLMDYFEEH